MPELCDLQIQINGQQTFFLDEKIISTYSGRLKKTINQEKRRTQIKKSGNNIEINGFPGGPDGFELVSRFCYNNGRIKITVSNVSLLYCGAFFLGMTENLLQQTETYLEGMFYWSWSDILVCLKSCCDSQSLLTYADSSGFVQKLISALLAKIAQSSSSSSSSSPETTSGFRFSSSSKTTPDSISINPSSSSSRAWWFDDMSMLPPKIIEKVIQSLGAYGTDNNSLILTRFLLHYLKTSAQRKGNNNNNTYSRCEYSGLADTAIHGVIMVGKKTFSCRGLFWVLRVVSGFGLNKVYRVGLERLIGEMLDQAKLDDLLVSGHEKGVYDVNLVVRLIRVFVNRDHDQISVEKMKKVGRLIDKYLGEISPDQNLKISKFLGVAESLPDSARDCFDGVYRAIDIYLESHLNLSSEERSRLCRCLNYEKLSLGVCKELAKNPRISPRIAVQALISQQSKIQTEELLLVKKESPRKSKSQMVLYRNDDVDDSESRFSEENKEARVNLERMQWRVVELEKVCREMKGQMSRSAKHSHNRNLPRLC